MTPSVRGRFAPSTTGRAHPGTLLAALLCWLDARSKGGEVWLRLEDLDRTRTKPGQRAAMEQDLAWFGLDWEGVEIQSESEHRYEERLDRLAEAGRLYACRCSRAQIREAGSPAPDGSFRYPGTCRARSLSKQDWRKVEGAIRMRLESSEVDLRDDSGLDLSGDPAEIFGDPLVRRRDGAYAYHLTSVIDDEALGINRVVRGRDLAPSTNLQVALRLDFGGTVPSYRHHLLLLEASGGKFSKFHGAVDLPRLRERYEGDQLCGLLAGFAGLVPAGVRCRPADLVADFDWARVATEDVALEWSAAEGLGLARDEGPEQ